MSARKIAYNTVVQIAGKIIGFVISGLLLVIVADRLGTSGMGDYVTVLAFVNFFVTIADLGANLVLVREIVQREGQGERITGEFLGFRLTFSLAVLALAPLVALLIPQYTMLIVWGVAIAAVAQFILLLNQLLVSVLQTRLQLDRATLAEIANRVFSLGGVIIIGQSSLHGAGFFYALLTVVLAGSLVNFGVTYFYARKFWRLRPKYSRQALLTTVMLVLPMGIFSILGTIHFKADTILLSLLKGSYDVGIYGYAYKIGEIIFTFPVMFVGAAFPRLSTLFREDRERCKQFFESVYNILVIGTIPFLTSLFFLSPHFTLILSRNAVADGILSGQVLQVLTAAFFFWFIGTAFIHLLIAANEYASLTRNLAIAVAMNVVLNLILIPRYSYFGAAWVTFITEAVMFTLTVRYVIKNLQFRPQVKFPWAIAAASLVAIVITASIIQTPPFQFEHYTSYGRMAQMGLLIGAGGLGTIGYLAVLLLLKRQGVTTVLRAMSL
jgi:O-antigen/teichoic acid export membrane protein